jgi:hypothetical protein
LQQEIAETLDEFVEIDSVGGLSGIFPVFDDFHFRASLLTATVTANCLQSASA